MSERGNAGRPALFEDGQLDTLDAAVGVRPSGLDEALAGAEPVDGVAELVLAKRGAVVRARFLDGGWPGPSGPDLQARQARRLAT
jgi:hypothetical protein